MTRNEPTTPPVLGWSPPGTGSPTRDLPPAACSLPPPRAYRQTGPKPAAKLARAEPVGVPARRPAHLSETLTERGRTGDRAERGRTAGLGLSLYNKWFGPKAEPA